VTETDKAQYPALVACLNTKVMNFCLLRAERHMSINNYQRTPIGLPSPGSGQCRVNEISPASIEDYRRRSEQRSDSLLTDNTEPVRDNWVMPSQDIQLLNWIVSKKDHKWFLLTVTYKDSSVVPKGNKYIYLFDTYVHRRIHKKIGYSHKLIAFVREYECSVIGSYGNMNCPHHIHCVLGIPVAARIDRLVRDYQLAIAHPRSAFIDSADLQELKTDCDVERAYCYVRKRKWHKPIGHV
jgi:hypothetical protein